MRAIQVNSEVAMIIRRMISLSLPIPPLSSSFLPPPSSSPFPASLHMSEDHTAKTDTGNSLQQLIFEDLIRATELADALPADDDYLYYRAFRPFSDKVDELSGRLLRNVEKFMGHAKGGEEKQSVQLGPEDDPTESFDVVVDVVDGLLAKVDLNLDKAAGRNQAVNLPRAPVATSKPKESLRSSHTLRPQRKFDPPADNSNTPFVPLLHSKPNALAPREARDPSLSADLHSHVKALSGGSSPHPYEMELRAFEYTPAQLCDAGEQLYRPLAETPCHWVSTVAELEELEEKLEGVPEFAVDLEQHGYRSFQGFGCLMQISTRTEDFLVDSIELRSHMHILNRSFTDPKIVKVLHGANSDIVWLQRDHGVYVVNMFDTGQAARVLEFPSFSLAYLLKFFCDVNADKKYQLADWRIRPLSVEMLRYAREDTHYLLYIYDRLRNELLARSNENKNLLLAVLERSRALCLRKYEKDLLTETSYLHLYNKSNTLLNQRQLRVFAALYEWRDKIARQVDESTRYVMPNHVLFRIAEVLATDVESVLASCNPTPPLVRFHANDIANIVLKAREDALPSSTPTLPIGIPEPKGSGMLSASPPDTLGGSSPYGRSPLESPPQQPSSPHVDHLMAPTSRNQGSISSPVLTTDQLYHAAGWLDGPHQASYSGMSDEEDEDTASEDSSPTASRALDPHEGLRVVATLSNDLAIPSALFRTMEPSQDMHESDEENARKAEEIRCSLGGLAGPQILPATNDSSTQPQPSSTDPKAESETKPTPSKQGFDGIPRSFAEIYKLSNKSRKRNKEKKKQKERAGGDAGGEEGEDRYGDEDDLDAPGGKKMRDEEDGGAAASMGDTLDFMTRIGWLNEEKKNELQASEWQKANDAERAKESKKDVKLSSHSSRGEGLKRPPRGADGVPARVSSKGKRPQEGRGSSFTPYDYGTQQGSSFVFSTAKPPPVQQSTQGFFSYSNAVSQSSGSRPQTRPKSGQRSMTFQSGQPTREAQGGKWPRR